MISARLGISRSAVAQQIDRMVAEHLVTASPSDAIELTGSGRAVAVVVARKHRVVERFLVDGVRLSSSTN